MRGPCTALLAVVCLAGCYSGARTSRDINAAWRGRTRAALEARWGKPKAVQAQGDGAALVWAYTTHHVNLPDFDASLHVEPGAFDLRAEARPGAVWDTTTQVVATVDAAGRITGVEGPSIEWGAPRGINLRWGTLFGFHAGMGRLDDTGTMLPSGGLYLGGMLGPRLGLVGVYGLTFGSDAAGGAVGMAWGMAAQWWPAARVWLRAGPAMILSLDPGWDNASLAPGLTTGASYALIRGRVFVLDLRLDVNAAPDVVFGSVGIGVNVN